MKHKKTILLLVIFLILLLIFILFYKFNKKETYDDIIFFKLFSQANQDNKNTKENEYIFDFSQNSEISTNMNLWETVSKNTLINEKIAPGTEGEFEIKLKSNKSIYYEIDFLSQNKKPQNLFFSIKGNNKRYSKLEDLRDELQGDLDKMETKSIIIQWKWDYDTGTEENIQDTKDGTSIKDYHFYIHAIGNER